MPSTIIDLIERLEHAVEDVHLLAAWIDKAAVDEAAEMAAPQLRRLIEVAVDLLALRLMQRKHHRAA